MTKWKRMIYEPDNNRQEFVKDNKKLVVPCVIGGKYQVQDVLSVGGFGAILVAHNTVLDNRKVLIKTTLYDGLKQKLKRLYDITREKEVNALRDNLIFECNKLIEFRRGGESRMPSIIELVYDFSPQLYGPHYDHESGEEFFLEELAQNEPYLVMQYIDGVNLGEYIEDGIDEVLKKRNYISIRQWEKDVLEYIKDICIVMGNFHRRQPQIQEGDETFSYYYIYRDLKPDNILVTYDNFITLIDFGGLLLVGQEKGQENVYSNYIGYGQPGVGTPGYMAPEMEESPHRLDRSTDIYTIGATLYSLLSGEHLGKYSGQDHNWIRIPYENLKGIYTEQTIEIIKKATQLNPNKRYQAANQMSKDIKQSMTNINIELKNIWNTREDV